MGRTGEVSALEERFEAEVEQAWRELRGLIADTLDAADEAGLVLRFLLRETDPDVACVPLVVVHRDHSDLVVEVLANPFVEPAWRVSRSGLSHLCRRLGFGTPDPDTGCYTRVYTPDRVDMLAAHAVWVLREGRGVAHPSLLEVEGLPLAEPPVDVVDTGDATRRTRRHTHRRIIVPTSPDHLTSLVEAILTDLAGDLLLGPDEDGDFAVPVGQSVIYVRVRTDRPAVQVFSVVSVGIQDLEAAHREAALLNTHSTGMVFKVVGTTLQVWSETPAAPFVPPHLLGQVDLLGDFLRERDAEIADRVGGHRFLA